MMEHDERTGPGTREDAENIVGAALFGLGRGANGVWINLTAIEYFRSRLGDKVGCAVEQPDWQANWRRERVYLLAHTAEMGRRAAAIAAREGRTFITEQDIDAAMKKVRGHLPIAGRWCPV